MVRLSLIFAVLLGTGTLAQAAVPDPRPTNTAQGSQSDFSYVVFFPAGKATLTPQAREVLRAAAKRSHAMHQADVRVTLPRDFGGAWSLFQNRARAVKTELVRDGVKAGSIANEAQPVNAAYIDSEPGLRAWRDRSILVKVVPRPNSDADGQVG